MKFWIIPRPPLLLVEAMVKFDPGMVKFDITNLIVYLIISFVSLFLFFGFVLCISRAVCITTRYSALTRCAYCISFLIPSFSPLRPLLAIASFSTRDTYNWNQTHMHMYARDKRRSCICAPTKRAWFFVTDVIFNRAFRNLLMRAIARSIN